MTTNENKIPAPPKVEAMPGGGTMVSGRENVAGLRLMTMRSGLRLEIKTGMKMSRGISILKILQNEGITTARSKAKAYEDLNRQMVEAGYQDLPL